MRIKIDMTQLEAAFLMSVLADTAQIAHGCGNHAHYDLCCRLGERLAAEIKSSRAELSEAELL